MDPHEEKAERLALRGVGPFIGDVVTARHKEAGQFILKEVWRVGSQPSRRERGVDEIGGAVRDQTQARTSRNQNRALLGIHETRESVAEESSHD